jgi:biotin carboxyl carrier protein
MDRETYFAVVNGVEYRIEIISETQVTINGVPHLIDHQPLKLGSSCSLMVDGINYEPYTYQENRGWEIILQGKRYEVSVEDERERRLRLASSQNSLKKGKYILSSPMPGLVIDVPVREGDEVREGDVLVVLESMKMQNELRSPRAGKITRIHTEVNKNVERNESLLVLE